MPFKIHEESRSPKRSDRGHRKKCPYMNMKGEACDCEINDPAKLTESMKMLGWEVDERRAEGQSFHRTMGEHSISVCLLMDGWQYRWEKGVGLTIFEVRGFGTIDTCLDHLWSLMARRLDEATVAFWEHGAMTAQLEEAGIKPARVNDPPLKKKDGPASPRILKHEVTAIMESKS